MVTTAREFLAALVPTHEWHTVTVYDREKQVIGCSCGSRFIVTDAILKTLSIDPKTRTALNSVPFPHKP